MGLLVCTPYWAINSYSFIGSPAGLFMGTLYSYWGNCPSRLVPPTRLEIVPPTATIARTRLVPSTELISPAGVNFAAAVDSPLAGLFMVAATIYS